MPKRGASLRRLEREALRPGANGNSIVSDDGSGDDPLTPSNPALKWSDTLDQSPPESPWRMQLDGERDGGYDEYLWPHPLETDPSDKYKKLWYVPSDYDMPPSPPLSGGVSGRAVVQGSPSPVSLSRGLSGGAFGQGSPSPASLSGGLSGRAVVQRSPSPASLSGGQGSPSPASPLPQWLVDEVLAASDQMPTGQGITADDLLQVGTDPEALALLDELIQADAHTPALERTLFTFLDFVKYNQFWDRRHREILEKIQSITDDQQYREYLSTCGYNHPSFNVLKRTWYHTLEYLDLMRVINIQREPRQNHPTEFSILDGAECTKHLNIFFVIWVEPTLYDTQRGKSIMDALAIEWVTESGLSWALKNDSVSTRILSDQYHPARTTIRYIIPFPDMFCTGFTYVHLPSCPEPNDLCLLVPNKMDRPLVPYVEKGDPLLIPRGQNIQDYIALHRDSIMWTWIAAPAEPRKRGRAKVNSKRVLFFVSDQSQYETFWNRVLNDSLNRLHGRVLLIENELKERGLTMSNEEKASLRYMFTDHFRGLLTRKQAWYYTIEYLRLKKAIHIVRNSTDSLPVHFRIIDEAECVKCLNVFFVIPSMVISEQTKSGAVHENISKGLGQLWFHEIGWAFDVQKTTSAYIRQNTDLLTVYKDLDKVDFSLVCNDAFKAGVWFSDIRSGRADAIAMPFTLNDRIELTYVWGEDPNQIKKLDDIGTKYSLNAQGRRQVSSFKTSMLVFSKSDGS